MTTISEKSIGIAAKMYECRNSARQILGEKYQNHMNQLGTSIKAVAKRDNCTELTAAINIIKGPDLDGMEAMMIMAAVVEIIEPSL